MTVGTSCEWSFRCRSRTPCHGDGILCGCHVSYSGGHAHLIHTTNTLQEGYTTSHPPTQGKHQMHKLYSKCFWPKRDNQYYLKTLLLTQFKYFPYLFFFSFIHSLSSATARREPWPLQKTSIGLGYLTSQGISSQLSCPLLLCPSIYFIEIEKSQVMRVSRRN